METVVARLLADLSGRGIELAAYGNRLRYRPRSALTPKLAERLRTHKAELLAILRHSGALGGPSLGSRCAGRKLAEHQSRVAVTPIRREACIEPPDPCPNCDAIVFWWNGLGARRCLVCDPPTASIRLLGKAEQMRHWYCLPSPLGAAEMLAELKRITGT